jgi:murein DD-endopeptidase MepM/ murein hydrolase activator NlpD
MPAKRMLFVAGPVLAAVFASRVILAVPAPHSGRDWTLALAPLSLGNPALAATLATGALAAPDYGEEAFAPRPRPYERALKVRRGDTLAAILGRAGVPAEQALKAVRALRGEFRPKRIKRGMKITVTFIPPPIGKVGEFGEAAADLSPGRFQGFSLDPDVETVISVSRATRGGDFRAARRKKNLGRSLARAGGTIKTSLYVDGRRAGVPAAVLANMIQAYSWDVDFQRDIRSGDSFEVMYERLTADDGRVVKSGRLLYAALTLTGKRHPIYLLTGGGGNKSGADYFDAAGRSAKKALMRTPIDGARLSSPFGKRRHPILGYTKMHRGVDFAAPRGTPIYAAGDGRVEYAGRKGGYGNYVRIRHNSRYLTAYAHMKAIRRGLANGSRVRQGQVIGYVGSTGRSTGPHLHYEIIKGRRQVNPLTVKMPSRHRLKGRELERFQALRAGVERTFAGLAKTGKLAGAAFLAGKSAPASF